MDTNTRSISGHHIPFSRDNDAFQDMTAFSPPSADNWLNRYSSTQIKEESSNTSSSSNNNNSSKIVKREKFIVPKAHQLEDPCKKYIESAEIPVKSNKSLGTDDHFKSAVCSKNLLKVCETIVSKQPNNNSRSSSSNSASFDLTSEDDFDAELSLMNETSRMEFYRNKYGNRRDSQSLPASPKMERKNPTSVVSHNPYFTITKSEPRQESGISFLTSLFGITAVKQPSEAQASLAQKYEVDGAKASAFNGSSSIASGGEFANTDQQQQQQQQKASSRQLTPKPHPYREMNIFSPTSM